MLRRLKLLPVLVIQLFRSRCDLLLVDLALQQESDPRPFGGNFGKVRVPILACLPGGLDCAKIKITGD